MIDQLQLLKRLEPPVRPACAAGPAAGERVAFDRASFGELLQLVSEGAIASGRCIAVAFDAQPALGEAQLERLARAADLAESHGARRAVMLLDQRALIMDVAERRLEGELRGAAADPVVGLDAAVWVGGDEQPPRPLPPPLACTGPLAPWGGPDSVRHGVRTESVSQHSRR
jgi:hypothetical protein